MKPLIAVLAAQGRSGQACVAALLEAGFRVRAGVRSASTLPGHPGLEEMRCDARNKDEVAALLDGADVAASMIGHNRRSSADVQSVAIQHCVDIIAARQPETRLISLTGTGVRLPGDRIPLFDRAANFAIGVMDPKRIADGKEHVRILQESPVDYTIIRVLKLTGGSHHGTVNLTPHGPAELFTPRARVGAAVVQLVESGGFSRAMPVISGTS